MERNISWPKLYSLEALDRPQTTETKACLMSKISFVSYRSNIHTQTALGPGLAFVTLGAFHCA